jgi:hypothetical protein
MMNVAFDCWRNKLFEESSIERMAITDSVTKSNATSPTSLSLASIRPNSAEYRYVPYEVRRHLHFARY